MGRELRMVPPNWEHPVVRRPNGQIGYQPMHNRTFEEAAAKWKKGFAKWYSKERDQEFWEYDGPPPEREDHVPWKSEDRTWFQVWETVSAGTPVTPPFATREELIEYLVANGDFWDQHRRNQGIRDVDCGPWSRAAAEMFVNETGESPTLIANSQGIQSSVEAMVNMGESRLE